MGSVRPIQPPAGERDSFEAPRPFLAGREPLLSAEESSKAATLYVDEGWSVRALADKWKVSYNAMHGALTRAGVTFRRPGRRPKAERGPEGKHGA